METRVRELRKRKGLTLQDLADRIQPEPTTAQTIGRLETGMRKMTLDWLEKIAAALDCAPNDLVVHHDDEAIPLVGTLTRTGRIAPGGAETLRLAPPGKASLAIKLAAKVGDLDIGDTLVCERSTSVDFADCVGKDCVVTTHDGQQLYGRLIQGSGQGLYTVIPATDDGLVLYDIPLTKAARRVMLVRYY